MPEFKQKQMPKTFADRKLLLLFSFFIAGVFLFSLPSCQPSKKVNQEECMEPSPGTPPANDFSPGNGPPSGVPAYPDTIEYRLPDDYVLKIFLRGDEHGHVAKTTDGYYLLMNQEGFYEYASKGPDNALETTGIIARNPEDRSSEEKQLLESIDQK